MSPHSKELLLSVMWDYPISPEEIEDLLSGKIEKAGHYTREKLFGKMLGSLPWFALLEIFTPEQVKELLTEKVIATLWPKSIQEKYSYVKERLQEALPAAG